MDDQQTIGAILKEFYKDKVFADDSSVTSWVHVQIGPLKFPFPNLKQRREAVYLHDLTHLLTGYDTTWTGEGEIAAWELASGFPRRYWIGYVYPPMTFLIGLIIAPAKVIKAFRRGLGQKNVYKLQMERPMLEKMTISELKEKLKSSKF